MSKDYPKTIVVDVDATIAGPAVGRDYASCTVISETVAALQRMHAQGWRIVIFSARGMRTHSGDLASITQHVLPVMQAWLDQHDIPYDEIVLGKPWPGPDGFYVDDRAIRPSEFATLSLEEIQRILREEATWSQAPPGTAE